MHEQVPHMQTQQLRLCVTKGALLTVRTSTPPYGHAGGRGGA